MRPPALTTAASGVLSCVALLVPMVTLAAQPAARGATPEAPRTTAMTRDTSRIADATSVTPVVLGTAADDWRRIADLLGDGRSDGLFLRAPSIPPDPRGRSTPSDARPPGAAFRVGGVQFGALNVRAVLPSVRTIWNSELPFGPNEGSLWAGRGASALVRGGVVMRRGRVTLVALPEVATSANRGFSFYPATQPGYSPFASPFFVVPGSFTADVPTRFGDARYTLLTLGQSSISVELPRNVTIGLGTENQWWGPTMRNAVVLSNNAAGFPHLALRTTRPWQTRLGTIEMRYLLGTLTPSLYFDTVVVRRYNAFNGIAATLRPARLPNLTVGLERATTAGLGSDQLGMFGSLFDAFGLVESNGADGRHAGDALTGLFFRYVVPEAHAEVYGEFARQSLPRRLSELVTRPSDGVGYTIGFQTVRPLGATASAGTATPDAGPTLRRALRVQIELSNLEQAIAFQDRPPNTPFYTGEGTPGGYTNRGKVMGAWFGPSGQQQFVALDLLQGAGAARQLGVYAGRVRWNSDAFYSFPGANFFRPDFSVYGGVRGTWRAALGDLTGDLTWAKRYNYLFQNGTSSPGQRRTLDVPNVTVSLGYTPR